MKHVILCTPDGTPTGTSGLVEAHNGVGQLHRAYSIVIFRENREEILIQKRSEQKPLFPGFWANSCCSHPQNADSLISEAQIRLQEELGFTTELTMLDSFVYQASDTPRGMSEHEYDTVLIGTVDNVTISPDPNEVAEWKWISVEKLQQDLTRNSEIYAPWLNPVLSIALNSYKLTANS